MLKITDTKKLAAMLLLIGWSVQANAFVFIDPSNLLQNTITAIEQVASYIKQVSDSARQIQEFEKHAKEFTNQTLGLDDLLGEIDEISRQIDDAYKDKEDINQFNQDMSNDPDGFFKKKYKKYTTAYEIYDKCEGLKNDALKICLRDKISYGMTLAQENTYRENFTKLEKQLSRQVKEFKNARSQKDRENAALAISATQAEITKAKEFNELDWLEYRSQQRIISEQKEEFSKKSFATSYSVAEKYKNIGSSSW